jgi:hypothetical protein
MQAIIGGLCTFLGWVGFVSATFIWVIKFLYDIFAQDIGFWSAAGSSLLMWVVQLVVSFLVLAYGIYSVGK